MTRLSRRDFTLAFLICLVALGWACSARRPSADPASTQPAPPEAVNRPEPPQTSEPVPALPPTPAAGRVVAHDETDCALVREPGESVATVALGDTVDPVHAPHPTNDSERLLFRQIYETLVRADCHGHAVPGLSAAWRLDADARTWLVTLRDNARFSDGSALTASDLRASWSVDNDPQALRPRVSPLVQSVVAIDDRTLAILLRSGRAEAPIALAHPDLAIAKSAVGSPWPLGTRLDVSSAIRSEPLGASKSITIERANLPVLRFLVAPGDPRDLLDRGADLLVTQDAGAVAYAATLPQLQSVALPWNRTLELIAPGRSRPSTPLTVEERQLLARDAVRGEARGAAGPFWWATPGDCVVPPPQARPRVPFTPRVIHDGNDSAARDLAERIVGLTRAANTAAALLDVLLPDRPARSYQRATAMSGEALSRARRLGNDAAYVAALDARPFDPCRELQVLSEAMPWLDPATVVPLVDTRPRAIVRKSRSSLVVEWDGALLIGGTGAQR